MTGTTLVVFIPHLQCLAQCLCSPGNPWIFVVCTVNKNSSPYLKTGCSRTVSLCLQLSPVKTALSVSWWFRGMEWILCSPRSPLLLSYHPSQFWPGSFVIYDSVLTTLHWIHPGNLLLACCTPIFTDHFSLNHSLSLSSIHGCLSLELQYPCYTLILPFLSFLKPVTSHLYSTEIFLSLRKRILAIQCRTYP